MARGTNIRHLVILIIGAGFMYYFLSVIWLLIIDSDGRSDADKWLNRVSLLLLLLHRVFHSSRLSAEICSCCRVSMFWGFLLEF